MSHMEPQVEKDEWYRLECGEDHIVPEHAFMDNLNELISSLRKNETIQIEYLGSGFCYRFSAPGYLDCTDWTGPYDTETEAIKDLRKHHCICYEFPLDDACSLCKELEAMGATE